MFKAFVSRSHPEFSSNRQQDAQEFFLHLVNLVEVSQSSEMLKRVVRSVPTPACSPCWCGWNAPPLHSPPKSLSGQAPSESASLGLSLLRPLDVVAPHARPPGHLWDSLFSS